MKSIYLLIVFVFFSFTLHAKIKVTKVACIGNSITYGTGVENREKNAWPQQLQNMLGGRYQVMNFGVNGTTLLKKGNCPYWETQEYKDALNSNPDLVFIKLGTNDSKLDNRLFLGEFEENYTELIHSFTQLKSHPRIVLLLPVPSFMTDTTAIWNPIIVDQIIPKIRQVAYQTHSEIINLYSLFIDQADLFPDQIHPNSLGATVIARRLYELVKLRENKDDIFRKIDAPKAMSSFFGFDCADFTFRGRNCKVVKPKNTASGLPWVWRARFWGHEPQTDIAMLERGYHLVYMDVAELFGNANAIAHWDAFYKMLRCAGLSEKTILEGMSRGGVYVYNWALANPEKVACIYADAPVLDLKSWPGGKGKSGGSKDDWEVFKSDYEIQSEEAAIDFKDSPLDNASKIAKLGFPMLHVVGDADDVVPEDENTTPFEQIIRKTGGDITVIHKPGVGHHPHSLANPTPIVNFLLRATNRKVNFAAIAAPGSEYRLAAGWIEGNDWWSNHEDIIQCLEKGKPFDIIFLGNSITQSIGGNRKSVAYKPGKEAFDKTFAQYKWESAGISGDCTQNLIWRVNNGGYKHAISKVIVVIAGVNNITAGDSPAEIAEGIKVLVRSIRKKMPATKILLLGPLPTGMEQANTTRLAFQRVHHLLSEMKFDKSVVYKNIDTAFIAKNGNLRADCYSDDGIHLSETGYLVLANELVQYSLIKMLHAIM